MHDLTRVRVGVRVGVRVRARARARVRVSVRVIGETSLRATVTGGGRLRLPSSSCASMPG